MQINIDQIDLIVFDFDGVLTNNLVFLNELGEEFVQCSRADGLAFDFFRKIQKKVIILSTEKNAVVSARARKLKVDVIQGVQDKCNELQLYLVDSSIDLKKVVFVGNDLNDLRVMNACGFAFCPSDAHKVIKSRFSVLPVKGGHGVARSLLEDVFSIDLASFYF